MADFVPLKGVDNATRVFVPVYVRTSVLRAATGSMLFAAIVSFVAAFAADTMEDRFECGLAAAINLVATWHYTKMLSIRESPPGPATEMAIEAVRLSDWFVTLPPLVIEIHMMLGWYTKWFTPPTAALLLGAVISMGAFVRLGTDELAPPTKASTNSDAIVRFIGFVMFLGAFALLAIVLSNAFVDLPDDPMGGWTWGFAFPWIGYGIVAAIGIISRNVWAEYSDGLSIFKDFAYSTLDIWSKAAFALFIASKALGQNEKLFGFEM
jgi:bacteriorhodopsin